LIIMLAVNYLIILLLTTAMTGKIME